MNKAEFEARRSKIKAEFAKKRDDLAREEAKEIKAEWGKYLDFKLKNCAVKAGDFVNFDGKYWRVNAIKIDMLSIWHGSEVYAHLERVKKDLTPTAKLESVMAVVDNLKPI